MPDRIDARCYTPLLFLSALRRGLGLFVDKPAPADQLNNSIKAIAVAADVLGRVHSHGRRLGATRDTAHV